MNRRLIISCIAMVTVAIFIAMPAAADSFNFSTGNPDGLIGTLSRPSSAGQIQTETADDFVLSHPTLLNQATFFGLIPSGTPISNIVDVEIEIYHVFPADSANPPSGNVPARANSPADVEIASATRDGSAGTLSFNASVAGAFHVANTVVNGIKKSPVNSPVAKGPQPGNRL